MSQELFNQLNDAYTRENLNRITAKIIEVYRNKQFHKIENLVRKLSGICHFPASKINKYFSQLVLMYHPDKLNHYKNQLNVYMKSPSKAVLNDMSHILITLDEIDKKNFDRADSNIMDGFEIEFGFDEDDIDDIESWNVYDLQGNIETGDSESFISSNTFITVLKIKEFGSADIPLPEYELKNLDGHLELSGRELDDLSGIDLCINLKSLDLCENRIMDITLLGYLYSLTALDLSGNVIDDISALAGLINLESLDLAFNHIDNIEPLLELPRLKYVNLVGNPVREDQIIKLKMGNRVVIS